jgi:thioredoxin-like negative regulator of GroEL
MDYKEKYLKYKKKYNQLKKNDFLLIGGSMNKNTLYLFKADWCHHCKNFKSTWEKLQDDMKNKVNFVSFDADKDKKQMTNFNIQGFPTLVLKQKNKAIEYVGERDLNSLKEFIDKYN